MPTNQSGADDAALINPSIKATPPQNRDYSGGDYEVLPPLVTSRKRRRAMTHAQGEELRAAMRKAFPEFMAGGPPPQCNLGGPGQFFKKPKPDDDNAGHGSASQGSVSTGAKRCCL